MANNCTHPATANTGDTIEHDLMSGFPMKVKDVRDCETDSARPDPHKSFNVTDPEGNDDWLCAYDVHPA
jgi:hypothetical protein